MRAIRPSTLLPPSESHRHQPERGFEQPTREIGTLRSKTSHIQGRRYPWQSRQRCSSSSSRHGPTPPTRPTSCSPTSKPPYARRVGLSSGPEPNDQQRAPRGSACGRGDIAMRQPQGRASESCFDRTVRGARKALLFHPASDLIGLCVSCVSCEKVY